ncbi:MAG: hypothetical protein KF724_06445 [Phycisphaeraceae bacterium]|nr:hypothetical protein [Phycisphaeraceae bacterium]
MHRQPTTVLVALLIMATAMLRVHHCCRVAVLPVCGESACSTVVAVLDGPRVHTLIRAIAPRAEHSCGGHCSAEPKADIDRKSSPAAPCCPTNDSCRDYGTLVQGAPTASSTACVVALLPTPLLVTAMQPVTGTHAPAAPLRGGAPPPGLRTTRLLV